jgi:hypothetical protein
MIYPKQLGDLCIPSPDPVIFVPSSSQLPFLMGVPGQDDIRKEGRTSYGFSVRCGFRWLEVFRHRQSS